MNKKIKVQVFGIKEQVINSGCGCGSGKNKSCCGKSKDSQGSCKGGCNRSERCCSSSIGKLSKTVGDAFEELETFINGSDVKNNTELEFIDLDKINLEEEKFFRIKEIINRGFEPPITVVDDIIRYYGGISNTFVYKDIKELLE